jgi:hypothetical protein
MTRTYSLVLAGALAIGATAAAPATSRADGFGIHVDVGRTHFHSRGFDYYRPYPHVHGHGHGHRHHGHIRHIDVYSPYYVRPIVVPDYYHWTPDRGYHSHGTIVVPHRGHSHLRPY